MSLSGANHEQELPDLPEEVETALYEILLDRPPIQQPELLAELCRNHPEVAGAIRARAGMMRTADRALAQARKPLAESPLPEQIAGYRIEALLGEGGFGTVYRAKQSTPVERVVALKVLHPLRLDERSQWRFQAERQVLARMQHRNIAQIFDAGTTVDGLHYFAMELVDGLPITAWCDRHRLHLKARIHLFVDVCAAIQHAHQRGVVHRDLTPNNVLVKDEGGAPVAKVIDFGVSKTLQTDGSGTFATRDGAMIGTPGYMSPEQAAGEPIDTRTDVYALGVLLFELLTGELPYPRQALESCGQVELARLTSEQEPRRLTTAACETRHGLTSLAEQRSAQPAQLMRDLRSDLQWIVRKALARHMDHRYGSVGELLADVERYREALPVSAREPQLVYLLRRFVARHRLAVALSAAGVAALIAGLLGLAWMLTEVDDARQLAEQRRDTATHNEYAAHVAAAQGGIEIGDARSARRHLDAAAKPLRDWEWRYLSHYCDTSRASLPGQTGRVIADVIWLDDDQLCQLYHDGLNVYWDPVGDGDQGRLIPFGSQISTLLQHRDRDRLFAVVNDYRRVVVAHTGLGLHRKVFEVASWPARTGLEDIRSLAISPDGRTLALSQNNGDITLVDVVGRTAPRRLFDAGVFCWQLKFVDDGKQLLLGTADGYLQRRRIDDGKLVGEVFVHPEGVQQLVVSGDERDVFVGAGTQLHKIDLQAMKLSQRVTLGFEVRQLALHEQGGTIYCAGSPDVRVVARSTETLELAGYLHGLEEACRGLALSPDGSWIAATGASETRVWSTKPPQRVRSLPAGFNVLDIGISASGDSFAVCNSRGSVRMWDARSLELCYERDDLGVPLYGCALSDNRIYCAGRDCLAIDRASGRVSIGDAAPTWVGRMQCSPDERWLAAVTQPVGELLIWSLPEMRLRHRLRSNYLDQVLWDASRSAFVVSTSTPSVCWVDPASGHVVEQSDISSRIVSLGAARNEVLVGSEDGVLWRPQGAAAFVPLHDRRGAMALAFSNDGKRIAGSDRQALVHLWNREGTDLLALPDAPKAVTALAFVAGGERLVALSRLSGAECYVLVWGTGL